MSQTSRNHHIKATATNGLTVGFIDSKPQQTHAFTKQHVGTELHNAWVKPLPRGYGIRSSVTEG
jgi:hypothetical protein